MVKILILILLLSALTACSHTEEAIKNHQPLWISISTRDFRLDSEIILPEEWREYDITSTEIVFIGNYENLMEAAYNETSQRPIHFWESLRTIELSDIETDDFVQVRLFNNHYVIGDLFMSVMDNHLLIIVSTS